jgi:hypothetical protein
MLTASSSPTAIGVMPKEDSGTYPAGLAPGAMLGEASSRPVRLAVATASRGDAWKAPFTAVRRRLLVRRLRDTTEVSCSELFWTVTSQVERPVSSAIVVGSQVWFSDTWP